MTLSTRSTEPVIPVVSLAAAAVAVAAIALWTWMPREGPTPDPPLLALGFVIWISWMLPGLALCFFAELRRRRTGPSLGIVEGTIFVAISLAGTTAQLYLVSESAAPWQVAGLGVLWGLACWILLGAGAPWKGWEQLRREEDESS